MNGDLGEQVNQELEQNPNQVHLSGGKVITDNRSGDRRGETDRRKQKGYLWSQYQSHLLIDVIGSKDNRSPGYKRRGTGQERRESELEEWQKIGNGMQTDERGIHYYEIGIPGVKHWEISGYWKKPVNLAHQDLDALRKLTVDEIREHYTDLFEELKEPGKADMYISEKAKMIIVRDDNVLFLGRRSGLDRRLSQSTNVSPYIHRGSDRRKASWVVDLDAMKKVYKIDETTIENVIKGESVKLASNY